MRVALCQIDTTVGDFAGNLQRILAAARTALESGAELGGTVSAPARIRARDRMPMPGSTSKDFENQADPQ